MHFLAQANAARVGSHRGSVPPDTRAYADALDNRQSQHSDNRLG
jgi:hypothetical protein